MQCPRCGGPTHVLASKANGVLVRRRRACGDPGSKKQTCGCRFTTIELPAGFGAEVSIKLTAQGVVAEVKKR
jgi:transcriptional regulator NrdR family protein